MNNPNILGVPLGDFARDRGFALFDTLIGIIALALLAFLYRRLAKARLLIGFSLRKQLVLALALLGVLCVGGLVLGYDPRLLLVLTFAGFASLVLWLMKDLARVGVLNAFETTRHGVSASQSLKEVTHELLFLGIGARKLLESPEFDGMLTRCKKSGGSIKLLLSSPDNVALEEMAKLNNRNDLSYRSRVKESIREIFTRVRSEGVNCEIRIYDLNQKISLPQFRLMFIDSRLCVFSQLFWSDSEGLDNPQLVLRRNKDVAGRSLYQGYRDYFDVLWELDTTSVVTETLIQGWPA